MVTDTPQSGYTRTRYGGTGGMAPVDGAQVIRFFGLDTGTPTSGAVTARNVFYNAAACSAA